MTGRAVGAGLGVEGKRLEARRDLGDREGEGAAEV